jgi:hypothetical protein
MGHDDIDWISERHPDLVRRLDQLECHAAALAEFAVGVERAGRGVVDGTISGDLPAGLATVVSHWQHRTETASRPTWCTTATDDVFNESSQTWMRIVAVEQAFENLRMFLLMPLCVEALIHQTRTSAAQTLHRSLLLLEPLVGLLAGPAWSEAALLAGDVAKLDCEGSG